ncbi:DUF1289 domain-containing protein [Paraglaciecola sp. Hal342]|uniref:Fe-S protein-like proteinEB3 n=1 Tax=Paraglaciecola agarilytica NO2 TaxID=1125747 RepID=A0ABQ0IBA9_9ALTE|nr:DUF1289 domain-containing protein [Paraglaciecola agarilytica]AEE21957.1 protein of unknown function DUF1289 [Glaciecola sp. 4H-3-7+YE-5]GAC06654.1 Fe-S protein-like proteinEB3 [Paraglaciecola agarilytica NO2]
MQQLEIFQIESPCIGVCQAGPRGYCLGCYRSREERLHWVKLEDEVKSKIVKACALRKKRAFARKRSQDPLSADTPTQGSLLD